ncbi:hypothetical protein MOE00_09120 [Bacillus inaquosorum]|uniref:Uncharacterized protein n=1 Tax=Bacillus inaquosorum TaxID=483913 RepID=A0A9Q4EQ44_9BACI|nr:MULTISPECIES: hypothetical protein [Bacillus]MCY7765088.1 hypothetical protein [Bacillus inaquosorum]MCY7785598.1 hypothetical protein [Bacillus inaquosorum]MCY7818821.1 hypothetical protein [Bacillus inaquosorum]MCY7939425.1 hypothetical protein [Bacillus inaquosorum]MCY7951286.1 hypothetical protein [Bacillus inaquosorum]
MNEAGNLTTNHMLTGVSVPYFWIGSVQNRKPHAKPGYVMNKEHGIVGASARASLSEVS